MRGIDLGLYLARIGWEGPLAPELATLRRLVERHTAAIPFEAVEALLRRTPALDPAGLEAKLLRGRRGGWCFEQNTLFRLVLEALGFAVHPLLARVRFGVPPGHVMPRNHLVLRVGLPEGEVLADVGFGGVNVGAPLALREGVVQAAPDGLFRLQQQAGEWLLQGHLGGAWRDLYLVGREAALPADIEAANWLVANRPGGLFTANLVAAGTRPGRRMALLNWRLTTRESDGAETVVVLDGIGALDAALRECLGIALDAAELEAVQAALAETRPGRAPP